MNCQPTPEIKQLENQYSLWSIVWPLMVAGLFLFSFYAICRKFLSGFALDLGSPTIPAPHYGLFLFYWNMLGTGAAVMIALGFVRLLSYYGRYDVFSKCYNFLQGKICLIVGSITAFAIPIAIRIFILQQAPVTDDESCYRFMAQLLMSGRLTADSPPMKLFFDHGSMINDGKLYAEYTVGWPALMVPGLWLGISGFINALYSFLTVPPLFMIVRRIAGNIWANFAIFLYLISPMLMIAAATEMSHTTCLMALTWTLWFALLGQRDDVSWWNHFALGLSFSTAFFIRPTSTLGVGLPILVWWGMKVFSGSCSKRISSITAFLIPLVGMATLFLLVNKVQNDSFLLMSYQRIISYSRENGFRFSDFNFKEVGTLHAFWFGSPLNALALTMVALLRLNSSFFGWPVSLFFVCFAGLKGIARFMWFSVICFCGIHFFLEDSGIDSFGPVHYFEITLPFLILSVLGLRNLTLTMERLDDVCKKGKISSITWKFIPVTLVAGFVLVAFLTYIPAHFHSLRRIGNALSIPLTLEKTLTNAMMFVPFPFVDMCASAPTRHFVWWWPNNDPDLQNNILWLNHITVADDRKIMKYFPGRAAYVMTWTDNCTLKLLELNTLDDSFPRGWIGGTGEGL